MLYCYTTGYFSVELEVVIGDSYSSFGLPENFLLTIVNEILPSEGVSLRSPKVLDYYQMAHNDLHTAAGSEKGQRLARARFSTQNRNRLPYLEEVLRRKTAPPVCLYNFYLYMRDREHSEEYLDFWLDIAEHEILCRHFVKDLRRAGVDVNMEYPEFVRYNNYRYGEKDSLQPSVKRNLSSSSYGTDSSDIPSNSSSRAPSPIPPISSGPHHAIDIQTSGENKQRNPRYRDSVRSNTTGNLSFIGQRPITREDIKFSADRIYYRYVVAQSEKEILLSDPIRERMKVAIEKDHRDDAGVFQEAKDEVLELMRLDPFPRFLKARAYGNMTILQTMIRLGIGLFFLFVGFAVEFSLIFLNKSRLLRLWGFIPIFAGVANLFANQTELSPLFVLLKTSETTFLQFQTIRELFIYKLQVHKGIRVFLASLIVSFLITAVFIAVPGHRL
ncbi:hypothetical protein G9A89_001734 [Geosiphon pyriformis]|nr:hypothetical protein G9A89_001734 [Geosiphon pyriformis]